MKFEAYLEAVKRDVYNELFNVDTNRIEVKKLPNLDFNFGLTLYSLNDKSFEPTMSLNKEDLLSLIETKKKDDSRFPLKGKDIDTFVDVLYKVRDENYYFMEKGDFVFAVGNKLYCVSFNRINKTIYIAFNELLPRNIFFSFGAAFKANSIMSSGKNSNTLFNKIRGILENEFPNWKKEVFGFDPERERSEKKIEKDIEELLLYVVTSIDSFMNGHELKEFYLKKINDPLKSLPTKMSNQIKEKIFSGIQNLKKLQGQDSFKEEIINFLKAIFNNSTNLPKASEELKKYSSTLKGSLNVDQVVRPWEVAAISFENSARTRIYRIIIKQLLGKNVFIKQTGATTLFSLEPIE